VVVFASLDNSRKTEASRGGNWTVNSGVGAGCGRLERVDGAADTTVAPGVAELRIAAAVAESSWSDPDAASSQSSSSLSSLQGPRAGTCCTCCQT